MVLPELLGGVLARHPFQDLGPAWVLVEEVWILILVGYEQGQGLLTPITTLVRVQAPCPDPVPGRYSLVMSYTPESTMIHRPLASSLCLATSATVYWFDMLAAAVY